MQAVLPNPSRQDLLTLARTIWGEARGEPLEGQIAVAQVILNRWEHGPDKWWNSGRIEAQRGTIAGTCLSPWQFSCWNDGDPNLPKLQKLDEYTNPSFRSFLTLARLACRYLLRDMVGKSTHYHTVTIRPRWSYGHEPVAIVGRHQFYEGIK